MVSRGLSHAAALLALAMGSTAFVPAKFGAHTGVRTMDTVEKIESCDALMARTGKSLVLLNAEAQHQGLDLAKASSSAFRKVASPNTVTSVSWPTSMLERPLPPSASFTTLENPTKSERSMREVPPWIGWNRRRSVVLPSPPPPPPASGGITVLTSLTHLVMLISPWKWSVPFVCSMEPWPSS
eukprot:1114395_1